MVLIKLSKKRLREVDFVFSLCNYNKVLLKVLLRVCILADSFRYCSYNVNIRLCRFCSRIVIAENITITI